MKCQYPNCYISAAWVPVIELPTLRSVGESHVMVQTPKPTVLLCQPVCGLHNDHYNLSDWISSSDWEAIRELALHNNYHIPESELFVVQFRPLGWTPRRTLEIVR